jgi:transposase
VSKSYPSSLTPDQWELIEPLLPAAKRRGRPRTELLSILNAIFYILCEGCTWRGLLGDFPAWRTVYTYFRNWRRDETWLAIHDQLYRWSRVDCDRPLSPSEVIVDSQSVKTATMVHESVGYDAAKQIKGRKRHLATDTLGLSLRVLVTAASVPEREGAKQLLQRVYERGEAVARVHTVWVDGGYDGLPFFKWAIETLRWVILTVLRPIESQGFVLLRKRWKVERTFSWWNWCRRLSKDYEFLPQSSETFLYLAMIRIMVRRLAA